jgi:hypothetical protein
MEGHMKMAAGGGGGLSVEVESLLEASARLEAIRATIEEIAGRHALFTHIDGGLAGSPNAAEAISAFLHRWGYGLSCLATDVAALGSALRRAARVYEKVEAEIVAGAGG